MEFKNTTRSEMNKEVCLPHPGVKIAAGGTCWRQPATMTEAPTNTCCFISKGSFLVIRWFWKGGHVLSTILWPRSWLKLTKSLWHYRRALEKKRKKTISKCWSLNYRKDGSGLPLWLINLEKQRRSKMCSMFYLLVVWWPWNFTFMNGFLSKHICSQLLGVLDY